MSGEDVSTLEAQMVRVLREAIVELEGQKSSIGRGELRLLMNNQDISQSYAADLEKRLDELRALVASADCVP